jgi:hypothetical protein
MDVFEFVGDYFRALVPYPAGRGEVFGFARVTRQNDGDGGFAFVLDGLSPGEQKALQVFGSFYDNSSSWTSISSDSVVRRVADGQLFCRTQSGHRIPIDAGKIIPRGMLNPNDDRYVLPALEKICADKEQREQEFARALETRAARGRRL